MNGNSQKPSRKDDISCVQLSKDTKEKLDKLGTKKDTYESIILSLMDPTGAKKQGEIAEEEDSDE
ncbi:MAG: hypothetical protein KGZ34_03570 [Nitrosarchaeum sp.]|nr:hypothetical protein [Nitrosarchaeum sp.]